MLVLAYTISSADLVQHWQAERGLQWNSILSILDLIPTLACAWEDATAAREDFWSWATANSCQDYSQTKPKARVPTVLTLPNYESFDLGRNG
jgi:hypothetical protein